MRVPLTSGKSFFVFLQRLGHAECFRHCCEPFLFEPLHHVGSVHLGLIGKSAPIALTITDRDAGASTIDFYFHRVTSRVMSQSAGFIPSCFIAAVDDNGATLATHAMVSTSLELTPFISSMCLSLRESTKSL